MRIYLFALLMTMSLLCNAQQDPQYSQYMFNMVTVNPGYAGSRNVLSLVGMHRHQWSAVEGAPRTNTFTADMPVLNNRVGVGLSVVNDAIGRFDNNSVNFYAAYRLATDRKGTLGMGLSGGFNMFKAELSTIRSNPQGTSDNLFRDYSKTTGTFGAGFFYSRDNMYIGLSAPNLLRSVESLYNEENNTFRKFHHLYLTAGYVFDISDEVKLKPSFMLKGASGAPVAFDLNANLWLHDVVGIGLSYRINNAVVGILEIQANRQLRFGYAIDYGTTGFKNDKGSTALTHEFLLRYEFGMQKDKVLSPRYF